MIAAWIQLLSVKAAHMQAAILLGLHGVPTTGSLCRTTSLPHASVDAECSQWPSCMHPRGVAMASGT
eukprot:1160788-Pelagomonas_calceolata.AAC.11